MRKKPLLTLLSTAALTTAAALSVPISLALAAPGDGPAVSSKTIIKGNYVVQMTGMPVVAYDGSIKGYAATKPRAGQKIDPTDSRVINYKAYLDARHDAAMGAVGGRKYYDYDYTFNGFAARLTLEQAAKLATVPGVLTVTPDEMHAQDTSSTPTFLGLDAPGGLCTSDREIMPFRH